MMFIYFVISLYSDIHSAVNKQSLNYHSSFLLIFLYRFIILLNFPYQHRYVYDCYFTCYTYLHSLFYLLFVKIKCHNALI